MKAATTDADSAAVWSRRLGTGIVVVDPTGATNSGEESLIDVTPSAGQSAALTLGQTYFFDLRLKTADGQIATAAWGYITARSPITSDLSGALSTPAAAFRLSSDGAFVQLLDSVTGKWRSMWLANGILTLGPEVD